MKIPILSSIMDMGFGPVKMEFLLALILFVLLAFLIRSRLKRGKVAQDPDAVLDMEKPAKKAKAEKKTKNKKKKGKDAGDDIDSEIEAGAMPTIQSVLAQGKAEVASLAPAELTPIADQSVSTPTGQPGVSTAPEGDKARAVTGASAVGSKPVEANSTPTQAGSGTPPAVEALPGDLKSLFEEEIAANPEMVTLLAKLDDLDISEISKQSKEVLDELMKVRGR